MKAGVGSRARAGTGGSKPKKGKRRRETDADLESATVEKAKVASATKQDSDWGILEPLHGILGPIVDPISSLISSNMIIGFLVLLLLISWFRGPSARRAGGGQVGFSTMTSPERAAAYEEIWRTEESELWKWLEERMGMEGASYPASSGQKSPAEVRAKRPQFLQSQGFKARMAEEKMSDREVNHAIKVTEEKLEALKLAVQKKRKEGEERTSGEEGGQEAGSGDSKDGA